MAPLLNTISTFLSMGKISCCERNEKDGYRAHDKLGVAYVELLQTADCGIPDFGLLAEKN